MCLFNVFLNAARMSIKKSSVVFNFLWEKLFIFESKIFSWLLNYNMNMKSCWNMKICHTALPTFLMLTQQNINKNKWNNLWYFVKNVSLSKVQFISFHRVNDVTRCNSKQICIIFSISYMLSDILFSNSSHVFQIFLDLFYLPQFIAYLVFFNNILIHLPSLPYTCQY